MSPAIQGLLLPGGRKVLLLVLLVLPWRRGCSMGLLRRVKSILRDLLRLAVLLAAMVVPALAALLIGGPTLKLTGVYLALATIALGEILRIVCNASDLTGGALGLSGIPSKTSFTLIFSLLALALLGFVLVARSRLGRAMEAMREDEVAAGRRAAILSFTPDSSKPAKPWCDSLAHSKQCRHRGYVRSWWRRRSRWRRRTCASCRSPPPSTRARTRSTRT